MGSRIFRSELHETDIICRYGGDEFVIVLPETTIQESEVRAQKLCVAVEEHNFWVRDGAGGERAVAMTMSAGLASSRDGETAGQLLQTADVSLYGAKRKGRNQVYYVNDSAESVLPPPGVVEDEEPSPGFLGDS